jgi:hypothetical protein
VTSVVDLSVDGSQVTERALALPDQARAIRISDADTYARACEFLKSVKALRDEITQTFDPHIKRAHEAHKALLKEKQDAEAPLAQAERIVKDGLVAYDREQERIRREEARRLEDEARRQEEERRLMEAIELEEAGNEAGDEGLKAEAVALLEQPIIVPTVAVAPSTPKVAGVAFRETWSAKVTDLAALVKYVAAHPQFAGLLSANMPALNAQARSLKGQLQIPGVEAVCTRDVAAGRR